MKNKAELKSWFEDDKLYVGEYVKHKIDRLDEPEVLSQEWIDENHFETENWDEGSFKSDGETSIDHTPQIKVIAVQDLQNLLVPKQEITFEQAYEKLREESILSEKSFDYYWNCINDNVEIDEPGNLLVPKQELPAIPRFVAEHIEEVKASGDSLDDAYALLRGIYHQSEIADWIAENKRNSETFARAWLDGYTVEEEQKYYVYLGDGQHLVSEDELKEHYAKIRHEEDNGFLNYVLTFTEQEIKDYDERFWAFAKPVEEPEE